MSNSKKTLHGMFLGLLICAANLHACAEDFSQEADFYATVNGMGVRAVVSLNGFVLSDIVGTRMVSQVVTSFLKAGTNRIEISFVPEKTNSLTADLQVKIVSTPPGKKPSQTKPIVYVDKCYANKSVYLYDAIIDGRAKTVVGNVDTNQNQLVFKTDADGRSSFACQLLASMAFERLPSSIEYMKSNNDILSDVQVHFYSSVSGDRVVCNGSVISNRIGRIDLDRSKISNERYISNEVPFDSVLISCESKTKAPVTLSLIAVQEQEGKLFRTVEFNLSKIPIFAWTRGRNIAVGNQEYKSSLWQEVLRFHSAMKCKDKTVIRELLKAKAEDLSKVTHQTLENIEQNQALFFEQLWSIEGATIQPISEMDFKFVLINDKVISVQKANGTPLIDVFGIIGKSSEKRSVFNIPLFYSLIDGRWVIVQ